MNLEGIALKLVLEEQNPEKALKCFSELNPEYFSSTFKSILKHMRDFYTETGKVPSLKELEVYRCRDVSATTSISSLRLLDASGIDIELALDELANQRAQNITLDLVDDLLAKISLMSRDELVDTLGGLPLKVEESITVSGITHSAKTIQLFTSKEETARVQMLSGISDAWDHEAGGYFRQELVLLGGRRGSGKSLMCANLVRNQWKQGKVSIYATIEMTAIETYQRIMAAIAQVSFDSLRKNTLSPEDTIKVAKAMASMFVDGDKAFEKHFVNGAGNVLEFQHELQTRYQEKDEGRIIILDDRDLSLATLDVQISKYKAMYGDELALVVVDYINQLVLDPAADPYDWKVQTTLGKMLKNLARKHDVCLVSPYQMADDGSTRFAKGILDAADLAQLIQIVDEGVENPEFSKMYLETTKARSNRDDGKYSFTMHWKTLTIDPREVSLQPEGNIVEADDEELTDGLTLL